MGCGLSGMAGSAGIGPAGLREIGCDGFSGWLADRPVVMPVGGGLLRERQRSWGIAGFWQGMGIPVNGVMPAQERVSAISLGWLERWSWAKAWSCSVMVVCCRVITELALSISALARGIAERLRVKVAGHDEFYRE